MDRIKHEKNFKVERFRNLRREHTSFINSKWKTELGKFYGHKRKESNTDVRVESRVRQ